MSVAFVRIHPAALDEAEAATDWYARRSLRAAERFLDELDRAIDQISGNPKQFPLSVNGTRRMVLNRFPFIVVFRESGRGLEIIAIAHGKRRPAYWRDRME